ncbi:glycosyltransferase family 39 protein, partial [Nostoc sp. CHAB 5834]|nr:glycosyltransferase family 39 protein [Nostoc sp. CHAB 5834]
MPNPHLTYIPAFFTRKGIVVYGAITLLTVILFIQHVVPLQWVLFNIVEVLVFFGLSTSLTLRWRQLASATYAKKLLVTALFTRLAWVALSYVLFNSMTGQPFEFKAADSIGYYNEGRWLAGLLRDHKWDQYLLYVGTNYSDMGYPFYLGLLNYVFGDNILVARLIKVVLGSYTCFFVYKLARNNFGESTGRMAGILTMLVPNLIYYCGLHVKETEMVFLTAAFMYLGDKLIRARRIKFTDLLWLLLAGASL